MSDNQTPLPTDPTAANIASYARLIMGAVAGYLIGKGIIDAQTASAITGAVVLVVPAIWVFIKNRKAHGHG